MLLKLFKRFGGTSDPALAVPADAGLLERANQLLLSGDNRGAIASFQRYLKTDPYNVTALNDMGACFADIGDTDKAVAAFELAYSLDDTFLPAMVNHAKLLNDRRRSAEALEYLERAKICDPTFMHADAVYAGVMLSQGRTTRALEWQLKSWLSNFDNLRAANSYLFWLGYDSIDESTLASEHRFWADTLRPPEDWEAPRNRRIRYRGAAPRIRVGYWSADFRNHSVRYFFRPLLENHDRSRFEVFLYHDHPGEDEQTGKIREHAEHFHRVHDLTDGALRDLMIEHELDVLVDLAGHTSNNRLPVLQHRLARVQINALGYPPTTGLGTIDAKLLDRHVATADAARYYTERPLVLPTSFWCFDPMEEAHLADEPPVTANGHVTFGSVGNVAKITKPVAAAWKEILDRLPNGRLVMRSIGFTDPEVEAFTRERLCGYGLPMDRIEMKKELGGKEFLASYNDIDIILDTFPFNGGTTTCFAVYMGVPVVTVTGHSLIGRMGLSVLSNVGAGELSTPDVESYVETAVRLAGDSDRLRRFKREARGRFLACALGNGKLFAAEFEAACRDLVDSTGPAREPYRTSVAPLPAAEILRRTYAVLRAGQVEAGHRLLTYCLLHHPDSASAHMLKAQLLVWDGKVDEALAYLGQRLQSLPARDQGSARAALTRMHLLRQDAEAAAAVLREVTGPAPGDVFDRMQLALYRACIDPQPLRHPEQAPRGSGQIRVVVPCDDAGRFQTLRDQLELDCACPPGWTMQVRRCDERERIEAYQEGLRAGGDDVLVILQKNVQVRHPRFIHNVLEALEHFDVVGCTGSRRWSRLDWRMDDFERKAGAFIGRSSERTGMYELHLLGPGGRLEGGMAILDGSVLAVRNRGQELPPLEPALLSAETLMEEAWTYAAAQAGWKLATCGDLGAFISPDVRLDAQNRAEARMYCNQAMQFDPFVSVKDDHVSVSAPVADLSEAVLVAERYFSATV